MTGHAQSISFQETIYDFGARSEEGGDFYHDFHFINTGGRELKISGVIPGPGCTASGWKSSYKPGESGFVRITYHPKNRVRRKLDITSQVITNCGGTPSGLTIRGTVNLSSHAPIAFFNINNGSKKSILTRATTDEYELVLRRFVDIQFNTISDIRAGMNAAPYYANTMNRDGSWSYLDYDNEYVTDWEPLYHLVQLLKMAFAYTAPASDYYGNEILYNSIIQGLKYWYKKNPTSKNWYANQISAPDYIVRILAVMEFGLKKTEPDIKKKLLERINNSDPRTQPTSGKVKLGIIHLIRGCLLKDDVLVSFSSAQLFEPIKYSENEGIQKDLSYLDHGRQLYIGGYGLYLVEGIINTISLLEGTKYEMPKEKMALLSEYVRGTYFNTYRSYYIDYSVLGRSIAIENSLMNKSQGILDNLIKYDAGHAKEYQDILNRYQKEDATYARSDRNQMFCVSDYMLHNRNGYDFSVRCVSTRTIHDEVANGEGLLSTYLAEGANNIRVFGDEYYNIFPVWEWDKIPGTTVPEGEIRNSYVENGERGHTDFVGGSSDGKYGVMTYLMDDHGVKAHKGWFMFDEEIVCLGSGIENSTQKKITTSINQCHLKNDVVLLSKRAEIKKSDDLSNFKQSFEGYIWHNSIAYYFPSATRIHLRAGNQKGSWNRINYNLSSSTITLPVFNLYIEHSFDQGTDNYEYIIIPGKSLNQVKKYKPKNIQILSNTTAVQAVYHKRLDLLEAIFYEPGSLIIKGKTLTVKYPCTLLLANLKSTNPTITISDPTQEKDLSVIGDSYMFL